MVTPTSSNGSANLPSSARPDGSFEYLVDELIVFTVATHLGWLWSIPKHVPFAFSFVYVGFLWDIPVHTVKLPNKKKAKYILHLAPWVTGASTVQKDVELVVGTLNHCCLTLPEGCSRVPSLYQLLAGFCSHESDFTKHQISTAALVDVEWWCARLSDTFLVSGLGLYGLPQKTTLPTHLCEVFFHLSLTCYHLL